MDPASPNTLTFDCPACKATLRVPGYLAGITGPCPRCQAEITAPNPTQESHHQQVTPVSTAAQGLEGSPPQMPPLLPVDPAPATAAPPQMPPLLPVDPAAATAAPPLQPPPLEPAAMELPPPLQTAPPMVDAGADTILPPGAAPNPAWPDPAAQMPAEAPAMGPAPGVIGGEPIPGLGAFHPPAAGGQSFEQQEKDKKRPGGVHPLVYVLIGLLAVASAVIAAFMLWPKSGDRPSDPPTPILIPNDRPAPKPTPPTPRPATPTPETPSSAPTPAAVPSPRPDPVPPQPTIPSTPPKADPTGAPEPAPSALGAGAEDARKALDAFLAANSLDARLKHVQAPTKVRAKMETYYGKHPLAVEAVDVSYKLSSDIPGGKGQFHIFQVSTAQQAAGFPVSVEETAAGPKVDWVSFIQFHDNSLGKFIKIYQHQAESFHAILERAHYFRTDVPELGSKLCFRIQPPIPGYEGYAFVERDSPLAKELEEKFEWDHMYFPIVELEWLRTKEGQQYIQLKGVLQDNWRADSS